MLAARTQSDDVVRLHATPQLLWIVPVMLYWLTRIWLLAGRGELPDDPLLIAASDPQSCAAGVLIASEFGERLAALRRARGLVETKGRAAAGGSR